MSDSRRVVPNHDFDDPPFEPIYYEGEEIEKQQLRFLNQPFEQSIDNYFDFKTPLIIKKEAIDKKNAEEAEAAKQKYLAASKQLRDMYAPEQKYHPKNRRLNQQSNPNTHKDEGGWNLDTRTAGVFDPSLKKNEIFTNQKEARKKKDSDKLLKAIKKNQSDPPVNFKDITEIESALSKQNANTVKAIIKTNEAKLKLLEDQMRREEAKSEEKSKERMNKIAEILAIKQKNQADIKKDINRQGFDPQPASKAAINKQSRSDIHPAARPKTKSSNYGPAFKSTAKSQVRKPAASKQFAVDEKIDIKNYLHETHDDKKAGVNWADQLDLLKEGYRDRQSNPHHAQFLRAVTPERPSYHSGYQQEPTDRETIQKPNPALRPASNRQSEQHPLNNIRQNLDSVKKAELGPLPHYASDKQLSDIGRLENQLKGIRQELAPIIQKLNTGLPSAGPNVELLSASIGRLMKIHAEKLCSMLIDDVIIETIGVLNYKEEMEKRKAREADVKAMAMALCEELNEIDVDQRFIFEKQVSNNQKLNPFNPDMNKLNAAPRLPFDFASKLIHDIHAAGGQDPNLPMRDLDSRDLRLFSKAHELFGKGPYKLAFAEPTRLNMRHELLISINRDRVLNEDRPGIPSFLKPHNQKAIEFEMNKIIDEVLDEVLGLFEQAQEEFVKEVIKEELQ